MGDHVVQVPLWRGRNGDGGVGGAHERADPATRRAIELAEWLGSFGVGSDHEGSLPGTGPSGKTGRMDTMQVAELWHYPVKSLQGGPVDSLEVTAAGIVGDRRWGIVPTDADRVLSAKRVPELLDARVDDDGTPVITLPTGARVAVTDPAVHDALSGWLGRPVRLRSTDDPSATAGLAYDMTFDPPDDDAEVFAIPVPPGTFLDLAPVHLLTTATLRGCAAARPDLDWDVRRFRPNVVIDTPGEAFGEDAWAGRQLHLGEVVLRVTQPTVRCAMPLRAQPARRDDPTSDPLARQPGLHDALVELNAAFPNHLGVYAEVIVPGTVRIGDPARVDDVPTSA